MRQRVLCGCWARLAFPRGAREKKEKESNAFIHSFRVLLAKILLQPSSAALLLGRRGESMSDELPCSRRHW